MKCIECKIKEITIGSKEGRCASCSKKGNRNGRYIDGRKTAIYYCIESNCHNKISYKNHRMGKGRCRSCGKKEWWRTHPGYNKGKKTKTIF